MRIMAVDYGEVRTGIAVSDESSVILSDAWVLHEKSQDTVAKIIATEAQTRNVGKIIIGYPKNLKGQAGIAAKKSEELAKKVRKESPIEVELYDERLTTVEANRILIDNNKRGKQKKNTVDAVAASLILDSYLTKIKNEQAKEKHR